MQTKIPCGAIVYLTAQAFDTTLSSLRSWGRSPNECKARFAAWHLVREFHPHLSGSKIGRLLGRTDHTTVLHGLNRARDLLQHDAGFAKSVERARELIAQWHPGTLLVDEAALAAMPRPRKREKPSPVKYEASEIMSSYTAEHGEGSEYEVWRRLSLKNSEARFLALAMIHHPDRVRVPVKEAAE